MGRLTRWGLIVVLLGIFSVGCLLFGEEGEILEDYPLPTLEATGVELVEAPTNSEFAAYYCPKTLEASFVEFACEGYFGAPPAKSELTFFFEIAFRAGNSGDLPLPVLELLLDLQIFEAEDLQSLGSTCVEFCGESDPECGNGPDPFACTDQESDIDSVEDAAIRALELVFIGLVTGGDWEDFEEAANQNIRVIPPGDELLFTVRFGVGIDALLEVFEVLAVDAIDDWVEGNDVEWVIPYQVGGRGWIDVPIIGRFGLDYGPLTGEWVL